MIDSAGMLVGIVTIDDMLDVAEEQATEDIQKLGGSETLDEPYTTHPVSAHGQEAGHLADLSFSGGDADRDRDAGLQW